MERNSEEIGKRIKFAKKRQSYWLEPVPFENSLEDWSDSFDWTGEGDDYDVPIIIQNVVPEICGILKKTGSENTAKSDDEIEETEESEIITTSSIETLTDECISEEESAQLEEPQLYEDVDRVEERRRLKLFIEGNFARTHFTEQENTELYYFIKDMCEALPGDKKEMNMVRKQVMHSWFTFIYMQFLGYLYFLKRLEVIDSQSDMNELALTIAQLIDEITSYFKIFHKRVTLREKVSAVLIHRLLGSRPMLKRMSKKGEIDTYLSDVMDYLNVAEKPRSSLAIGLKDQRFSIGSLEDGVCSVEFEGILKAAHHLTSEVIVQSEHYMKEKRGAPDDVENLASVKVKKNLFSFPQIWEFSESKGVTAIQEYIIETWQYSKHWRYSVVFLLGLSDSCSDYYFYEVKWCIPTNSYPIAQATASVFFKVEVCRIKPKTCPVNVTYRLEGNSYEHDPFDGRFEEGWLSLIIDSKLRLFQAVRF